MRLAQLQFSRSLTWAWGHFPCSTWSPLHFTCPGVGQQTRQGGSPNADGKAAQDEGSVELRLGVSLSFTPVASFLAVPVSSLSGTCVLLVQRFGGDVGSGGTEEGEGGGACVGPGLRVFSSISHVPPLCRVPRRANHFQVPFPGFPNQLACSWVPPAGGTGWRGEEKRKREAGFFSFPFPDVGGFCSSSYLPSWPPGPTRQLCWGSSFCLVTLDPEF